MRFPDDAWREILDANGFFPSGAMEEVWRSPDGGIKVKIDVNRETDEPYYEVITENGSPTQGTDAEELKSLIVPKEPEPPKLTPKEEQEGDDKFLKDMGIIAKVRTENKMAGRSPRFSFSVPMQAAGNVAFHLAKAGMKDFDVAHFKEDDLSMFTFPSEPEMHVAEEIIRAEFADQISARKGYWAQWAETGEDPFALKSEREVNPPKQYVASNIEEAVGKFAHKAPLLDFSKSAVKQAEEWFNSRKKPSK